MRRAVLLGMSPLLLVACSEFNIHGNQDPEAGLVPDIMVDPLTLSFGTVAQDENSLRTFTVYNEGASTLEVSDITLDHGSFKLITYPVTFALEPGENKIVEVAFLPIEAHLNSGLATIHSDDPDEAEVYVELLGDGAVPELQIDPQDHDFGQIDVPCEDEVEITMKNVGVEPLIIARPTYETDGQLELTDHNSYPMTLQPEESTTVMVHYGALDSGSGWGEMHVLSNDPAGEKVAEQWGEGGFGDPASDDFEVAENPPVDILFAVDQSGSMDGESTELGLAFDEFITQIDTVTTGWRIGVVSIDECFNEGILTSTTASYASKFQSAVVYGDDPSGTSTRTEQLFSLVDDALENTSSGRCNSGFLRTGALLHVIFVSDEPEQSSGTPSYWVDRFRSHVSNDSLLMTSIIGDLYDWCGEGSDGYIDAANMTGGMALDICTSDWATHVDELAMASLTAINTFQLSETAAESSIEVTVNGTLWTTGWHYESADNSVVFDELLESEDEITVNYNLAGECL